MPQKPIKILYNVIIITINIVLIIVLVENIGLKYGIGFYLLGLILYTWLPILIIKERREFLMDQYFGLMRMVEIAIWGRTLDGLKDRKELPKVKIVWGKKE